MVYQTEKTLNENADKVSDEVQQQVKQAIADTKQALEQGDAAAIESRSGELEQAAHRLAEEMYKSQAATGGPADPSAAAGTPPGGNGATQAGADEVIDAEVVDESRPS